MIAQALVKRQAFFKKVPPQILCFNEPPFHNTAKCSSVSKLHFAVLFLIFPAANNRFPFSYLCEA